MGLLSPILRDGQGGVLIWWCPGCHTAHQIKAVVDSAAQPSPDPKDPDWTPPAQYYERRDGAWSWNGSAAKPSFMPSVLVHYSEFTDAGEQAYQAWCSAGYPKPVPTFERSGGVCHCFVVDGQMQFLNDCTHSLAGQTIDIPPWPQQD